MFRYYLFRNLYISHINFFVKKTDFTCAARLFFVVRTVRGGFICLDNGIMLMYNII